MLYLVEGLNCSGKTTWLENNGKTPITSPWANPLRWELLSYKSSLRKWDYLYGVYETIFKLYEAGHFGKDAYIDRSFISAYVYGSIDHNAFQKLLGIYSGISVIFIDTPVEECEKRWVERSKVDKRDYVNELLDQSVIRSSFIKLLTKMVYSGFRVDTKEIK